MQVIVTVSPGGETKIDIKNGQGDSCASVTDGLKKALGGQTIKDEKKPEYYQPNVEKDQTKNRGW